MPCANIYGDSQRTTPATTGVQLTGSVATDVSKHIYDLAGNCVEYTMEKIYNHNGRVVRGGYYQYAWPISQREWNEPAKAYYHVTARVALYIK